MQLTPTNDDRRWLRNIKVDLGNWDDLGLRPYRDPLPLPPSIDPMRLECDRLRTWVRIWRELAMLGWGMVLMVAIWEAVR